MSVEVGESVGGYRIVRELGRGGFARVYLAEDATGARFALKILEPDESNAATARSLFDRELAALRRVDSRNVVQLHEASFDADPPWIAFRIAGTQTIRQALRDGSLEQATVLAALVGAVRGLVAMHEAGMTHRDVTLDNILITPGDGVLLDLGIVTLGLGSAHTQALAGKLDYLAPEQWESSEVHQATDVWQWAVAAVKALTGHLPFSPAKDVASQRQAILTQQPNLAGLQPQPLKELVQHCLDKQPSKRPTSQELLDACSSLMSELPRSGRASSVGATDHRASDAGPILKDSLGYGESADGTVLAHAHQWVYWRRRVQHLGFRGRTGLAEALARHTDVDGCVDEDSLTAEWIELNASRRDRSLLPRRLPSSQVVTRAVALLSTEPVSQRPRECFEIDDQLVADLERQLVLRVPREYPYRRPRYYYGMGTGSSSSPTRNTPRSHPGLRLGIFGWVARDPIHDTFRALWNLAVHSRFDYFDSRVNEIWTICVSEDFVPHRPNDEDRDLLIEHLAAIGLPEPIDDQDFRRELDIATGLHPKMIGEYLDASAFARVQLLERTGKPDLVSALRQDTEGRLQP